jgi:hypothetical protein
MQPRWRKSSRSGGAGECVEVATTGSQVWVRDSKDRDGAVLRFAAADWQAFLASIMDDTSRRP